MDEILRRTRPAALTAIVALLYAWIGLAAHGWDRILGIVGGLVILAALVAAQRSMFVALVLLVAGALPLAVTTWWSIVTPMLAMLALLLGWSAIDNLSHPGTYRAPATTLELAE